MDKLLAIVFALIFVGYCTPANSRAEENNNVKTLAIKWQRLLDEKSQTCQRCGATQDELQKAFQGLRKSLAPLGIKVILEEKVLDSATCAKDASQSNRIWVGNRPLEEWLDAKVGRSPCGFCCAELGDQVECRTIEVGGQVYEIIPEELIIKAGLLAASQLFTVGVNEQYGENRTSTRKSSSCGPCQ